MYATVAKQLSIMIYGDFPWNHLGSSYQRAFDELGHKVTPCDLRQAHKYLDPWLCHRATRRLTINSGALRRLGSRKWNEHIIGLAREVKPDLAFILKGDLITPETLRTLRQLGARVLIFHPDNPFPGHPSSRPEYLPCAHECDCYFIWSASLSERLMATGVKTVQYLPFGWDPVVFPLLCSRPDANCDVSFIGGWDKEREALLTPLAHRFELRIWGPDYWSTRIGSRSPLRRCWQGKSLSGEEASHAVLSSRISLNILRQQNLPDGVNMRTFEIPGCGGFLLSTRSAGATDCFPEDRSGAYFSDVDECVRRVSFFLREEKRRQQLALEAHGIALRRDRYVDRAAKILETYVRL